MKDLVAEELAPTLFASRLLSGFGALALAIATLGVYAVFLSLVTQRTREIAIRLAVGSTVTRLAWWVTRRALELTGIGLAIGIGSTLLLSRWLVSLLFGVAPTAPLVLCAIASLRIVVALAAIAVPIHRACHVDPIRVLRAE